MNEFELGVIEPKIFSFEEKFSLESGKSLDSFELIYETSWSKEEKNRKHHMNSLASIPSRGYGT